MQRLLYSSLIFLLMACAAAPSPVSKINGISYVANRIAVDSTHIQPVININANSAAIMPFGFIRNINDPEIIYNSDRQWYGETKAGAKQYISELNRAGLSIMLKPQIWIWRGEFTGTLVMNNEEDWEALEKSYANFILDYADLAQEMQVQIFCIGTELELFIKNRPQFWFSLIKDIRNVYKGKLTYAANWDEFWRTPFWDELDYIGIDAYFPVSNMQTPTVKDCIKGWASEKVKLANFSKQWTKPILFTEFGYRSVDYTAKEPWKYDRSMTSINLEGQSNATEALFQSVWDEPWFAGGYIWKWFVAHDEVGGPENNQFTPQNKPVEALIAKYYSK
ncbi:glycoside hydrolase family 113 [Winogradskyella aurantiaca]|uniref:glycoside hydrolase family 113 n=1 Tax=Winogradskyella aurantiaca TaxID=2219558 RepID=UPI000E1DE14F|nr:glycoside hydrolase [Winogradskyella aurantiaca]